MTLSARCPLSGRRLLASLAAAAVLVSGCSTSLPTAPVPQAGLPVEVQPRQDVQRLLPRPQPGASASEIVSGFLAANVGFGEDEDVARDYLTQPLARAWVPTTNVLVLGGTPTYDSTSSGSVTVTAPVLGRIDEDGRLVEEPAGASVTRTFQLTPVQGEWRISTFPDGFGLWLSAQDLDTAFRAYKVYYLNPTLSYFVPEVRWLARGEGLHTSLTRAQLGPVPPWLEGAVVTGASPDLRLTVSAVPVDPTTQVATVNLQGNGLGEDPEQVRRLQAQLAHSLTALIGVSGLDLRIGGRPVGDGEGEGPVTTGADLGFRDANRRTERALLRRQEHVVVVDTTQSDLRNATPVPPRSTLPTVPSTMTGLAASEDLATFAAVSQDRTELWRWRDGVEVVNSGIGDGLTDPTYDPHGFLWTAGQARGGNQARLWFVDALDIKNLARPIEAPELADGEQIRVFRISPDGTRALLVVGRDDDPASRLLVAGVVRDAAGRPAGLSEPVPAAPPLTSVTSARWSTPSELVAIGMREGDQHALPFRVPLGGWIDPLPAQAGLDDIIAIPDGDGSDPVVRTDDGRFHTAEGSSSWAPARNGDELVVPGT